MTDPVTVERADLRHVIELACLVEDFDDDEREALNRVALAMEAKPE